jgi:serine/threonine-protein kinase
MPDRPQPSQATKELDPLIGLTISGRYRVHTLLGQGGMGKVFQAQQIPLGRSVALKVLEASRVDSEFHRRFFQEAAILAKLQSRHTVTIYDYGRDGDIYFIAMELVGGGSLDRVIAAEGPFPPRRALAIAMQIARSLREAHAQGVIHRDLKPANVVLTQAEDGEELAKVLDFGLAKRLDRDTDETQADTVPGSPKYMAPEVIRQLPIDGRTDMYALGIMLYQMLTGFVPFDRPAAMDILVAHLQEPPRPMREMNPKTSVPAALERVVMRCIEKTPDRRYADMQQLLDTLRSLAAELGMSQEASWAGASVRPDAGPSSGVRRPPETGAPAPRVAAQDLAGPVARRSRAPSAPRTAWVVLAGCAIAAALILGVALWRAGANAKTAAAALPAPQPTPAPVAPAPQPTAEATGPDMVISAEEAARSGSVHVDVTSDPPGAAVFIRGKHMGVTPASFEWNDPRVKPGAPLVLVLKHEGYANQILRRPIEGASMTLSATLVPVEPAPGAARPAAAPQQAPSADEEPPADEPADLRALQDRAKAVAADAPVMVVKPTNGDTNMPAPDDEAAAKPADPQ